MLFFVHGPLDDSVILCLRGSNPGVWVAKSPPPRGQRASQILWCPQRDVRVRLAPPAFAASLRSLRAALENAYAFPQLCTLSGSNPGISAAKSPLPQGQRASQFKWCPQRDVRVRLAPPAFAASLRSLRAALENAYAFPQLRTLSGSNPGAWAAKSPSPRG